MALMNFTPTVLKNLFSKPVTNMYPAVKKEYPKATRGSIDIDIDDCIFCGICAKKCPTEAIRIEKFEKSWIIERLSCINCAYCVDSCPKKCLKVNNQYTSPSEKKYADCFKKESEHENKDKMED